jgi:hypothetical protein
MFQLRERLITDYSEYIQSFLKVRDQEIRGWVEAELDAGALWPEPLLSVNPTFELGPLVDELVETKVLHSQCSTIFRRGKAEATPNGFPLRLYRHQEQAVHQAQAGRNYVLTTGTGSGKSLSYILPIVDTVLKQGSGKGVRAGVPYQTKLDPQPANGWTPPPLPPLEELLPKTPAGNSTTVSGNGTGSRSSVAAPAATAAVLNEPEELLLTPSTPKPCRDKDGQEMRVRVYSASEEVLLKRGLAVFHRNSSQGTTWSIIPDGETVAREFQSPPCVVRRLRPKLS